MFEIEPTSIEGCYLIHPFHQEDSRGLFIKLFQSEIFREKGLCNNFKEQYFSVSKKNVIRGMHFQLPPSDQCKMVYCINGFAGDVVLDLRTKSRSYKQFAEFELNSNIPKIVYIPRGVAHGFIAKSNNVVIFYNVETNYIKESDSGVLWNSFGYNWLCKKPIISERDKKFIDFKLFQSPF